MNTGKYGQGRGKGKKKEEKKQQKKKLMQHRVFVFGHPFKYDPRRTGLNFVGTVLVV